MKPPPSFAKVVPDQPFPFPSILTPEQRAATLRERELLAVAARQLEAPVHYCLPRSDKQPFDSPDELHKTDQDLRVWIDDADKQGLNAVVFLQGGVVEARFFGPDQTLNQCFFAACAKVGVSPRYAFGRASKPFAASVLFKLRDDEAKRLDDDYAGFKPKPFTLDDARRGVVLNHSPPSRKGVTPALITARAPGSLMAGAGGLNYDLIVWRDESGQGPAAIWRTAAPAVEFFQIVRAAVFASILNIVTVKAWEGYAERRSFSEWLARVTRDGQAINANVVFSRASRAVVADPAQAEALIALICENRSQKALIEAQRLECVSMFQLARKRLDADPGRLDVAGWSIIRERFGEEAQIALRGVLNVGADSTLLEDFAERYLFCNGEFIDRQAFKEGRTQFVFTKDVLALQHAPDLIQTGKKPVEAFAIFIKSKLRQDVTDIEIHPDREAGSILRITRQGAIVPDDDYAPEHSRLVFNEWAGLYIKPAKTIDAALKAECEDKLDHMLSLVARTKERAAWIKAHFGWILRHPGQKQQVALVCTGDQGTGKTFLCTDFAIAVFGAYAGKASVKALENQFYIPSYVRKLWVTHDEVVSKPDTIEIVKDLIRSTRISGEFKNKDPAVYTTYARLSFTSNEANPGLSRNGADRGLFQVTSITAESEGLLPGQLQERLNKTAKPFYKSYAAFLQRDDVRQAYVKLLLDCAPDDIAEVEDLTYSAMRDADVAAKHLTPAQLVAKTILETGTMHSGLDIAMPFGPPHLRSRVTRIGVEIGVRGASPDAVLDLYREAGILHPPENGKPFMFKFKIGSLQKLFGEYLGASMHSNWVLEPNDYMPNDWRDGDALEPWKGKGK